ncbi:type II secretion system protein [Sulfurimonas sp.]|jgi:general secretion pathway protein G|uniref:pilin n=1 Tax=Sulfurimonas sp. TaxID=2022749 RepID=UPI0025D95CF5|nr:type II secretion system protein [Sulfurimonas sp.]MBT5934757.1 type II secretion system protein [Sulfurimonas sp.]
MKTTKKAFTMIELVFVIVILGVLAAVAIPKLSATRTDAQASSTASSIMTGATEIVSYAIAKGETVSDLSIMSNSIAALVSTSFATLSLPNKSAIIKAGVIVDCVTLKIDSNATDDTVIIEFGSADSDVECSIIQSLIDADEYPMKLRGSSVVY